ESRHVGFAAGRTNPSHHLGGCRLVLREIDDDGGPLFGQNLGDCPTDTPGTAGYHRYLSVEPEHVAGGSITIGPPSDTETDLWRRSDDRSVDARRAFATFEHGCWNDPELPLESMAPGSATGPFERVRDGRGVAHREDLDVFSYP